MVTKEIKKEKESAGTCIESVDTYILLVPGGAAFQIGGVFKSMDALLACKFYNLEGVVVLKNGVEFVNG
jgi:hypothetical protein